MNSRTFVMGDIHGAYRALRQCLERSGFDYQNDRLIFLGDVCDGWPETRECVEELLKIRNCVFILGNHDWWARYWMTDAIADELWLSQGGAATVLSYRDGIPDEHIAFFKSGKPYLLEDNRLFVHAGIIPGLPVEQQTLDVFLWNRELAKLAMRATEDSAINNFTLYAEVFLGHTPINAAAPLRKGEVWLMDTGAGWSGVLSMMNISTYEVFTSDPVPSLYPGIAGRTKKK